MQAAAFPVKGSQNTYQCGSILTGAKTYGGGKFSIKDFFPPGLSERPKDNKSNAEV